MRLQKTSSNCFRDVFITPCKNGKTSSRYLFKFVVVNTSSILLQDVFNNFLSFTAKTFIYRKICLGHTFEKFMVGV